MAGPGAPLGSKNAANGKRFKSALERALAHAHGTVDDGLLAVAQVLVGRALDDRDATAAREIADRMDGKPHQSIGTDSEHGPLQITITATETKL